MSITGIVNAARSAYITVTGDRITPARNSCAVYASLASRAVFPLSLDHPDTQVALEFFSTFRNLDALFNGVFGPLCGVNSDSTYGFLPWIVIADDDEKLADAIINLLGPDAPLGRMMNDLSPLAPNFYKELRENWGNEFEAVMRASEQDANNNGGEDPDAQTVFTTHPIPLSMTCYFSTRVMHEPTNANLRAKSRLEVPPHMLLPNWTPPIVTQKFTATLTLAQTSAAPGAGAASSSAAAAAAAAAGSDRGEPGGDLTVSALRVSVLTHFLFRMIRCLVMFGQCRDKQSYLVSLLSAWLGPPVRAGIRRLPPPAARAAEWLVAKLSRAPPRLHRFRTVERLAGLWTRALIGPSIGRSLLHRERALDLLLAGQNAADDARLLALFDQQEVHASALMLMLPSMAHVYGTPVYGEASRNPLSDSRHLNLVECSLPLLADFVAGLADALEAQVARQLAAGGGKAATAQQVAQLQAQLLAGQRLHILQQQGGGQQGRHPSEKLPRHSIHDVAVPARFAIRVAAGIARQAMMSMFYSSTQVSGSSSSASTASSSSSLSSVRCVEHVSALWFAIARAWTALAQIIDPLNTGLRTYEAVAALFTDFAELCMRAEGTELRSAASAEVVNNVCAALELFLIPSLSNNQQQHAAFPTSAAASPRDGGSAAASPATAGPAGGNKNSSPYRSANQQQQQQRAAMALAPFVNECSDALERMQAQGGPTTAAMGALADALDAALCVNGLFDFLGEGTTGETVASFKCYAPLTGASTRSTVAKLFRHLNAAPSVSAATDRQQHEKPQQQLDPATQDRLRRTFAAVFGEATICDASLLDDGAAAAQFRQATDASLSAARQRRNDDGAGASAGSTIDAAASGAAQRMPHDPRTAVLSAAGRRRLLHSADGAPLGPHDEDCEQDGRQLCPQRDSRDLRFASAQQRAGVWAFGAPPVYVPHPDEIAALARVLHAGDVVLSALATHALRWQQGAAAPRCPLCGAGAPPLRVAARRCDNYCTAHPARLATWQCMRCCARFCASATAGETAAAEADITATPCVAPPRTAEGYVAAPRDVDSGAAAAVCCERCFVVMRPADDDVQLYWVERSSSVRCPDCVLPTVRVTLLRYLARSLLYGALAVLLLLYYLFWPSGDAAAAALDFGGAYYSYNLYDAQQQQQIHQMMMQQQQGYYVHGARPLFVEDFY